MVVCPNCKKSIIDNSHVCPYCGTSFAGPGLQPQNALSRRPYSQPQPYRNGNGGKPSSNKTMIIIIAIAAAVVAVAVACTASFFLFCKKDEPAKLNEARLVHGTVIARDAGLETAADISLGAYLITVDNQSGVAVLAAEPSCTAVTDANGNYELRLTPGAYAVKPDDTGVNYYEEIKIPEDSAGELWVESIRADITGNASKERETSALPETVTLPSETQTTAPPETYADTEAATSPSSTEENTGDYSAYLGKWSNSSIETGGFDLEFTSIEGSSVVFNLSKITRNATRIAEANGISAVVSADGTVEFQFEDTFFNKGHGTLTLNGDSISLNLEIDENANNGFGLFGSAVLKRNTN